jgi:predicted Rossmann fold nucleotide-binding protein DprA/Smf involved in DNA uptake
VLDALFGAGVRSAVTDRRPPLHGALSVLLSAIAEGAATSVAFARAGLDAEDGLAALAELELSGYVHREQGGRFSVVP